MTINRPGIPPGFHWEFVRISNTRSRLKHHTETRPPGPAPHPLKRGAWRGVRGPRSAPRGPLINPANWIEKFNWTAERGALIIRTMPGRGGRA